MVWMVGVDVGGTQIKMGVVSAQGRRVLAHRILPTRSYASPSKLAEGLSRTIEELRGIHGLPRRSCRGVGIGLPGLVDGSRGIVHQLVNLPGRWQGVPFAQLMARRLGCRCVIDNDANVVALGEWRAGAGRGTSHGVYLTLGTGVGGGIISHGHLVRGATGSAGEPGHMVLLPGGPRCGCGRRGCLESLVSTAAILRQARAAMRWGHRTLRACVEEAGELTPAVISTAAARGDAAARRIWAGVGEWLGIGVANLVNLLNPECVVIGGGVGNAWPWFSPALRATVRRSAFSLPARTARIVRGQLGVRAGVVGATYLLEEDRGGHA
ncbi:MAG: ROK family protein [Candidatus Omnitrophica bacterium]|nr:ROK family protein [Candidatus Omnitrophota bacterium]